MSDLHRINGRWFDSLTSPLCLHSVHRSEKCEACDVVIVERPEKFAGTAAAIVADLTAKLVGAEQCAAALERERDLARADLGAAVDGMTRDTDELRAERDTLRLALEAAQDRLSHFESGGRAALIPEPSKSSSTPKQK